jgi:hypothetical protein
MSEPDKLMMEKALQALDDLLTAHEAHTWEQVGRCVYCADCAVRLYQGRLPKNKVPPRRLPPEPKTTTEMRARWNKE